MPLERLHEFSRRFHEFEPVSRLETKRKDLVVSSMERYAKAFESRQNLLKAGKRLEAEKALGVMMEHADKIKSTFEKNELHSILHDAVDKGIIHYSDLKSFTGLVDKQALESVSQRLKQGIQIRQATTGDLAGIMQVEKRFPGDLQTEESTYKEIIGLHPEGNLVAEKGGKILAYLSSIRLKDRELSWGPDVEPSDHDPKGKHTFIWSLAVLPSHEGLGIESELMKKLVKGEHGREIISITPDAKRFYETMGFKQEDVVGDYYNEGEDAPLMVKIPEKASVESKETAPVEIPEKVPTESKKASVEGKESRKAVPSAPGPPTPIKPKGEEHPITETVRAISKVLETHTARDLSRIEEAVSSGKAEEVEKELQRLHGYALPLAIKEAMVESKSPEELERKLMEKLQPKSKLTELLADYPDLLREGVDHKKIVGMAREKLTGEETTGGGLSHTETAILASLTHDTVLALHEKKPFGDRETNKKIMERVKEIEEKQGLIPNAEQLLKPFAKYRLEALEAIAEAEPEKDAGEFYNKDVPAMMGALTAIPDGERMEALKVMAEAAPKGYAWASWIFYKENVPTVMKALTAIPEGERMEALKVITGAAPKGYAWAFYEKIVPAVVGAFKDIGQIKEALKVITEAEPEEDAKEFYGDSVPVVVGAFKDIGQIKEALKVITEAEPERHAWRFYGGSVPTVMKALTAIPEGERMEALKVITEAEPKEDAWAFYVKTVPTVMKALTAIPEGEKGGILKVVLKEISHHGSAVIQEGEYWGDILKTLPLLSEGYGKEVELQRKSLEESLKKAPEAAKPRIAAKIKGLTAARFALNDIVRLIHQSGGSAKYAATALEYIDASTLKKGKISEVDSRLMRALEKRVGLSLFGGKITDFGWSRPKIVDFERNVDDFVEHKAILQHINNYREWFEAQHKGEYQSLRKAGYNTDVLLGDWSDSKKVEARAEVPKLPKDEEDELVRRSAEIMREAVETKGELAELAGNVLAKAKEISIPNKRKQELVSILERALEHPSQESIEGALRKIEKPPLMSLVLRPMLKKGLLEPYALLTSQLTARRMGHYLSHFKVEGLASAKQAMNAISEFFRDEDAYGFKSAIDAKSHSRIIAKSRELANKIPETTERGATITAVQWDRDPKSDTFNGRFSGDCTSPPGEGDYGGNKFWANFTYLQDAGTAILNLYANKKPIGRAYIMLSDKGPVLDSVEVSTDYFTRYGSTKAHKKVFFGLVDSYCKELYGKGAMLSERVSNRNELKGYAKKEYALKNMVLKKLGVRKNIYTDTWDTDDEDDISSNKTEVRVRKPPKSR